MPNIHKEILVISNYKMDAQFSMLKFADLLTSDHDHRFEINEIFPVPILGKLFYKTKIYKWAAYFDKILLFSKKLKYKLQKKDYQLVHILDHSNSIYLPIIKNFNNAIRLITCHDLIAVKSHLGFFDHAPKLSYTGHQLQNLILKSLNDSNYWVCDSMQTKFDINKIIPCSIKRSSVIHLGTNFCTQRNGEQLYTKFQYILHVGSDAWYKNRKSVLKAYKFLKELHYFNDLKLFFVGPKLQPNELDVDTNHFYLKNKNSIKFIRNITNTELASLYNNALLLLFPSFAEGFGWPPIEATLCGCQVITSPQGAIKDILKNQAHYIDPFDQDLINSITLNVLRNPKRNFPIPKIPSNTDCKVSYFELYKQLINELNY